MVKKKLGEGAKIMPDLLDVQILSKNIKIFY